MGDIDFNFETVEYVLQQIEKIRTQIQRKIIPDFGEIMQQVCAAWNSEAGQKFYEATERELDKLMETEKVCGCAADLLREAAYKAEKTERQAKGIAETRRY